MSKDAKHVIAVTITATAGHAQRPRRIDFPPCLRLLPLRRYAVPSSRTLDCRGHMGASLSGYSTLPHVPDLKTQEHREEKEPKSISMREGKLSHRACLWEYPLVKAWGVTPDDEHHRVQRDVPVR
ncbi:hypothetical protein FVER53590_26565 [Fusarium verticillioides]|nr:hypothetical protein FVER53590_26565 [Fusarium verticillioides]